MSLKDDAFNTILSAIESSASVTRQELKDHIQKENEKVLKKLDEEKQKIAVLEDNLTKVQSRQLHFERLHRKNNIIIFGLEKDENVEMFPFLISFFQNKLSIVLNDNDFNNAYSLKSKQNQKSAPIKVEFVNYWKKEAILKNCRKLKGSKIFIAEDLCAEDREELNVLRDNLKLAREKNLPAKIIRGNKLIVNGEIYTSQQLQNLNDPAGILEQVQNNTKQNSPEPPKPGQLSTALSSSITRLSRTSEAFLGFSPQVKTSAANSVNSNNKKRNREVNLESPVKDSENTQKSKTIKTTTSLNSKPTQSKAD